MSYRAFEQDHSEGEWSDCEEFVSARETFAAVASAVPAVLETMLLAASINAVAESPIEVFFGVEFAKLASAMSLKLARCRQDEEFNFGNDEILLIPQYEWSKYRIDWVIKVPFLQRSLFFVECDGREFHSTEPQIRRDRQKDHLASQSGISMFRFTGSDLERNAHGCARIVLSAIERQYFDEKRKCLRDALALRRCGDCHFKVELPVTLNGLAIALRQIHRFHKDRGLELRQGPPERRYNQKQDSMRWYFEKLEDADGFQKSFGGRLICSSVL